MTGEYPDPAETRQRTGEAEETPRPDAEDRYRDYYENAPDAYLSLDAESGRIVDVNQTAVEMLRLRKIDMLGHPIFEFLTPDSDEPARAVLERLRDHGVVRGVELQVHRTDGTIIDVSLNATGVREPSGRVVRGRFVLHDIGRRKRVEEELQTSRRRYLEVLKAAPDAMIIANGEGLIIETNEQAKVLFGYDDHELAGRPVEALLPERFRHAHVDLRRGYAANPGPRQMGTSLGALFGRRKDGSEFPVDIALNAVENEDGMRIIAAVRDITERRRMEEALQQAREDLERKVAQRVPPSDAYELTFRELSVLHLIAEGKSDKEIADVLGIRPLTASKHVTNILSKMSAASRTEAGVRAVREGLVT